MSLDSEVIDEIAAELAIDPAFVEKDWYSVQVLKAVAEQGYQHFVDAMSYSDDEDTISFDRAVANLEAMIALFKA